MTKKTEPTKHLVELKWSSISADLNGMAGWAVSDPAKYWAIADRISAGWRKIFDAVSVNDRVTANLVHGKVLSLVDELFSDGDPLVERLIIVKTFLHLGSIVGRGNFAVETKTCRYTIQ